VAGSRTGEATGRRAAVRMDSVQSINPQGRAMGVDATGNPYGVWTKTRARRTLRISLDRAGRVEVTGGVL